jgi:hypothetical protein
MKPNGGPDKRTYTRQIYSLRSIPGPQLEVDLPVLWSHHARPTRPSKEYETGEKDLIPERNGMGMTHVQEYIPWHTKNLNSIVLL